MRPRSSTSVFKPFSVSSFAAQPPLIPEPTTIASNEFCSMLYLSPEAIASNTRPHYGPLARSSGSVPSDQSPDGRNIQRASHVVSLARQLWLVRGLVPAGLGIQILLCADRATR